MSATEGYRSPTDNIPAPPPPPPTSCNAPPPPPFPSGNGAPPPPPVFGGAIPSMRLKSEISDRKEPPAAIQNMAMTKDKKPFTYTPGGIDLSEIRSPRMQKRIVRNLNAPDTHIPQPDASKPKPVLTPGAQAAMQPQTAFPVFPAGQVPSLPGHGNQNYNGSNPQRTVTTTSTPPPQQTLPPPPPQRSSQLLNSPLSEGTPKANLPWLAKPPPQKEIPPWVHDNSETQYPATQPSSQSESDGRNTPTFQEHHNTQPSQNIQSTPQHYPQQRQFRPSPLTLPNSTNQPTPPNRWSNPPQQQQQEPQWQQSSQKQQWRPATPQSAESPAQVQWQSNQQQQRQHSVEIPIQREGPTTWQPSSPVTNVPPQFKPQQNIPQWQQASNQNTPQWQQASNQNTQQWQTNPPPPPQRSHTPQPQRESQTSSAGHNVRVIPIQIENGSNNNQRWNQPSSPQINGNGTPIQSKSFKVLQHVTNTSDASEFLEGDSFTIDGVPFSQFSNLHISNQGNFKTNVPNYYPPQESSGNVRNRGGYVSETQRNENEQPEYSRAQTDPRYVGEKIPSRSFQVLQAITKPYEDMKASEVIQAPFVPVPQVQVRIMTNVPKSPGTPQPSDNPPQFMQHQGNTSSHTYQIRQAMTSSQTSGRPDESEF